MPVFRLFPLMRSYLSTHHLWTAEFFSQKAKEIEDENAGKNIFSMEHRAYVMYSIISSVAFMEAAINEIYQDIVDKHDSYIGSLDGDAKISLKAYWKMTDGKRSYSSFFDKYQMALLLLRSQSGMLEPGEKVFQDASLLNTVRNLLVHFKPESTNKTLSSEKKIVKELQKRKILENKILSDSLGNPLFPDYLGYKITDWAVRSARNFVDEFFERIDIVPNYQRILYQK